MSWRVGSKVPLNVYDGDRPVCQCHNVGDAALIVDAMNGCEAQHAMLRAELQRLRSGASTEALETADWAGVAELLEPTEPFTLRCETCRTEMRASAFKGECPVCGNGTVREIEGAVGI